MWVTACHLFATFVPGDLIRMDVLKMASPSKRRDTFRPVEDFLLVEPIPVGETAGGIALPEGANHEPELGRIVKCGPGVWEPTQGENGGRRPMPVAEGDLVHLCFVYNQPIVITLDNKKYIVVRARDIVATEAA